MKRRDHTLRWLLEPLEDERSYLERPMFGCLAAYLHGRLMLVLADGDEPWNGVLVPTSWDSHRSLIEDFPALSPHPVLGKWLYLPQSHEDFESVAQELTELARSGDIRLGVEPKERRVKRNGQGSSRKRQRRG
jgi:hypothetical protein